MRRIHIKKSSFNTQPPEGGWGTFATWQAGRKCFNTQPPEGGWYMQAEDVGKAQVSTHSRPKAAGKVTWFSKPMARFQHTAARRRLGPLSKALLHQVSQP